MQESRAPLAFLGPKRRGGDEPWRGRAGPIHARNHAAARHTRGLRPLSHPGASGNTTGGLAGALWTLPRVIVLSVTVVSGLFPSDFNADQQVRKPVSSNV